MSTWSRVTALWERIGPRTRDVVFILLALAASVGETLARRHERPLVWLAVLAAGLVASGALWWRRRYPLVVTFLTIASFAATNVAIPLVIALFSLAVRRRDRVLVVTVLVTAATFAVMSSFDTANSWVALVAGGLLEAGFLAAAGAYVGARRDLVVALRERALRAEQGQDLRAEQARLGERARIAREMHDVLAHKVSLIAMHAGALEVQRAPSPQQVTDAAALIRTTARQAMEDLREVLGVLRDGEETDLAPQPQRADIDRLVDASRATGMHVDLRVEVVLLPDTMARTAHRVVREGLTNVHKHARGAATCVSVTGDEQHGLTVEIVNLRPVASATLLPGSGVGLLGLRERVGLLGGTLEAGPSGEGGWRLAAWLPWTAGETA